MSVVAAGYVLTVLPQRRELLLNEAENGDSFFRSTPSVAEPVPNFEHSRRAPLIVFASFEDGKITHIADGKKGVSAGTGLARLNLRDLKALARPIGFDELRDGVAKRFQAHLKRGLAQGGILPPKTLGALVDRMSNSTHPLAGGWRAIPNVAEKHWGDWNRVQRRILHFRRRPSGSRWRSAAFRRMSF